MITFHDVRFSVAYLEAVKNVLQFGDRVEPRGEPTLELQNISIETFCSDGVGWVLAPGRGLNYAFGLVEAMTLFTGINDVDFISYYNKNIRQFSDDGKRFHGHYGERISGYLDLLVDKLKADPQSRQAVLNIWDNVRDTTTITKDLPCNTQLIFSIRRQMLHLTVIRRSSDAIWGAPHDHLMFRLLQFTIARSLGCHTGNMLEVCSSFHIYLRKYKPALDAIKNWIPSSIVSNEYDSPGFTLRATRDMCWTYYKLSKRWGLHGVDNQSIVCIMQRTVAGDIWWGHAFAFLCAYHLWRDKRFIEFNEVIATLSPEFRRVTFQTFYLRAQKLGKLKELEEVTRC